MHDGEPHSAAPLTWLAAAFVAASSTAIVQIGSDARWLAAIGALIARGPCDSARRRLRGRAVGRVARRAGARTAHVPRPRVALRRQGPRPRADRRRHDGRRRARARSAARGRARRSGRGRPARDRRGRARDVLRRAGGALLPRALPRARPAPALRVEVPVEADLARRAAARPVGEPARRRAARLRRARRVPHVPAGAVGAARVGLRARRVAAWRCSRRPRCSAAPRTTPTFCAAARCRQRYGLWGAALPARAARSALHRDRRCRSSSRPSAAARPRGSSCSSSRSSSCRSRRAGTASGSCSSPRRPRRGRSARGGRRSSRGASRSPAAQRRC